MTDRRLHDHNLVDSEQRCNMYESGFKHQIFQLLEKKLAYLTRA